eukprot:12771448-Ditylum_brightwellii.AAC.1
MADIKRSIAFSIIIGDLMHYIGMILVLVAALTNEGYGVFWLLGAFISHHLYDLVNYPGSPFK